MYKCIAHYARARAHTQSLVEHVRVMRFALYFTCAARMCVWLHERVLAHARLHQRLLVGTDRPRTRDRLKRPSAPRPIRVSPGRAQACPRRRQQCFPPPSAPFSRAWPPSRSRCAGRSRSWAARAAASRRAAALDSLETHMLHMRTLIAGDTYVADARAAASPRAAAMDSCGLVGGVGAHVSVLLVA